MKSTLIAAIFLGAFVAFVASTPGEFQLPKLRHVGCAKMREDAERLYNDSKDKKAIAIIVPECDSNGEFKPLQCHKDSEFCQCWDREGLPYTQPKHKLRNCKCPKARADKLKGVGPDQVPSYVQLPACEDDGLYTAKQCVRDSCHCVDPRTGEKNNANVARGCKV